VGGYGVWGDGGTGYGVFGSATGAGVGTFGTSTGGTGVLGSISSTTGQSATVGANSGTGNGVYGKLTGSSTRGTDAAVYGNDTATGSGAHYGVYGVSTDSYAGYFNGVLEATSGLRVNTTCEFGSCSVSDRRLKKNIQPLKGALDSLLKLTGETFEWREADTSPDGHGEDTSTQTGFIAQDVEPIFPAWIGENKEGYKTLNIPSKQMAALTVESLRTLKAENDALKAKVVTDHATLMQLKDELDSLKAGKDPMTGDRGMLWLFGMVFAVGGAVVVTRKQGQKQA
jgi:hypothetical protein